MWIGIIVPLRAERPEGNLKTNAQEFRFAFSKSMLREFNENDAKASMRVWVENLSRERHVAVDPEVKILDGIAALTKALQLERADAFVLPTDEFWALHLPKMFDQCIFAVTGGTVTEEYVLLVHQAGGIATLGDLRYRSLALLDHSRMCLAGPWLDSLLLQEKLAPAMRHFGRITAVSKLTKATLPVFFRQMDACVVTRKGFDTMAELNPQLGKQLRVLAFSPALVPTAFYFRSACAPEIKNRMIAEVARIHDSIAGRQVLTVFQTERLEERPLSCLAPSIDLLETHQQLLAAFNALRLTNRNVSLLDE